MPTETDQTPRRVALPAMGLGGLAPTVLVSNHVRVEPAPMGWRLEGYAPTVIIAPVKADR